MTEQLDREGIFKMRPVSWKVKSFEGKKSIAIAIEFVVLAELHEQLDDQGGKSYVWQDWKEYAEVHASGDYFVVGKEGQPNTKTCQQLADSMGWRGSLRAVVTGPPPECEVQVTVKPDTYKGETRFKCGWMNPGDYVPTSGGADASEVDALEASFGSLLRAATSSNGQPKKAAPPATQAKVPAAASEPEEPGKKVEDYGPIPF